MGFARKAVMRRKTWGILVSGFAVCFPGSATAWGRDGHRVVAEIAELRLTPAARQGVNRLLALEGTARMGDVASWADQVKHTTTKRPAHTIRLALSGSEIGLNNCPNRFCVVSGIEYYSRILRDKNAKPSQRLEALKYVVHLVGDAHVPLHTAQVTGGKIKVTYGGETTTLHKIWDREIIRTEGGNQSTLAKRLNSEPRRVNVSQKPIDWAIEGRNIARDVIFKCFPVRTKDVIALDGKYADANWPIIRARLSAAGYRLAGIINQSF